MPRRTRLVRRGERLVRQREALRADYRVLPWTTFTDPEVAHVGHNEASARAEGVEYEVVRYPLGHLDRAVTEGRQ
jgi:pyruvate/2-oxoglutarate dehydrogenase complex dihydrolipoamide dehydrogenase (E3) component